MTFATPALLAGVALIAVPIVLHLVMRQRPKHLEFPALRFVQSRRKTNHRQMRLRHLLLLLLRCAAIALVAISLARPSIGPDGFFGSGAAVLGDREAPVAAALVFDTSPRMLYRQNNSTRLDDAREMGLWLLTQLPEESQVAVVDSKREPTAFSVDPGAAQQRVERLAMTAAARPLFESIDEALRTLGESEKDRKELYVFSDVTIAAWPPEKTQRLRRLLEQNEGVTMYIIDVGATEPRNFSLSALELKSGPILSQNTPLEISAELSAVGESAQRTIEMRIRGPDGRLQPHARKILTVDAGDAQFVEFPPVTGLDEGLHQGYLEITEDDSLYIDNRLHFTFEVRKSWPVLVAAPQPEEVYADKLLRVLEPPQWRREKRTWFACDLITIDQLAERSLDSYSVVCLLDPTSLSEAAWDRLFAYAADGGSVAIFLGRNASPENLNGSAAQQVMPAPLGRVRTDETYLVPVNLEHPAVSWIKRIGAKNVPWRNFPVYKHWLLEEVRQTSQPVVIIEYANGLPALIEQAVGRGRVVTMTTPISDSAKNGWNLIPHAVLDRDWPFMALVIRLFQDLVGSNDQRLNYIAGEPILLRLGTDRRFSRFLLTPPPPIGSDEENKGYLVNVDPKDNSIYVTATDTPGDYRIEAGGRAEGVLLGFSANLPPRATDLARVDREELKDIFGDTPVRVASNRDEIQREVAGGRVGAELFEYFIILLACVLLAEHILATRFYRRTE